MNKLNAILLTDAYKLSHHQQYPEGTSLVFSNFTPRGNKYAPEAAKSLGGVVVFGVQLAVKKLVEYFDENFFYTQERAGIENKTGYTFRDAINQGLVNELKQKSIQPVKDQLTRFFGSEYDTTHFEKLWDLGYLPLEIRALEEGTICPIRVPMLTIYNTDPEFYWLPNFLETILSQFLWKPMTSATIALSYRKILTKWAKKTNPEAIEFVNWQGHDFSMRGLDAVEATIASGLGHLTSFYGTDSMPTIFGAAHYYNEDNLLAGSVPATEHSVMCAGSKEDELGTFRRLLKTYPTNILSVVSDTWDLWHVVGPNGILSSLKEEILARDGKLVIRPDSGDPVDILCGTIGNILETESLTTEHLSDDDFEEFDYFRCKGKLYKIDHDAVEERYDDYGREQTTLWEAGYDEFYEEVETSGSPEEKGVIELLWDVFGGTTNDQGYKVLDSHIGAIYGDSITPERAEEICRRLEAKGFASTNVVFGIGSYTYQHNTRDTFGHAMKATYVEKTYWTGQFSGNAEVTEGFEIFKDPITDDGLKKSAKGLLMVVEIENELKLVDQISWDAVRSSENLLKPVFIDGDYMKEVTLTEIRERINKLV